MAMYTIGAIFGALSTMVLGDRLGRRRMIFFASGIIIIGAALMASSFSLGQLIVARLLVGLGTGATTATVPVWQSELSKASNRGSHVVTEGLFIGVGIALSLWIDFGFYYLASSSVSWRCPLALEIPFSIIVMAFVFTLPESPRWLLKKGRTDEAREILAILADVEPDSEHVNNEMADIEAYLAIAGIVSRWDLLKMGPQRIFHRTVLAAGGQFFSQICGINCITFYAITIFQQDLKLDSTKSRILGAAMETIQILGGGSAVFTIDRFGRRKLMLISAAGMSLCMIIAAGTTSATNNTASLVVGIVVLFAFNWFYPFGFLGLTYLYSTEVAPLHLRASISGLSNAVTWLTTFVVVEITPVGFSTIENRFYIIWTVINAAIVVVVYFFFPETNGRSLEEMDAIFAQSKNIFDPPKIARAMPRGRLVDELAAVAADSTNSPNEKATEYEAATSSMIETVENRKTDDSDAQL
jgi:sugar porter (SP) family MFS transporter